MTLGKPLLLLRNGAVLRAAGQQGDVPVAQAGKVLHRQRPAAAVVAQEDALLGGGGNIRGIPHGLGYGHMGQPRRLPDGFQGWAGSASPTIPQSSVSSFHLNQ